MRAKERPVAPAESIALDVDTTARMLGVSASHVRNMVKDGTIPHTRLGRRILISRAIVMGLLEPKAVRKVRKAQ
jgi:excisionase family DNA binding protein